MHHNSRSTWIVVIFNDLVALEEFHTSIARGKVSIKIFKIDIQGIGIIRIDYPKIAIILIRIKNNSCCYQTETNCLPICVLDIVVIGRFWNFKAFLHRDQVESPIRRLIFGNIWLCFIGHTSCVLVDIFGRISFIVTSFFWILKACIAIEANSLTRWKDKIILHFHPPAYNRSILGQINLTVSIFICFWLNFFRTTIFHGQDDSFDNGMDLLPNTIASFQQTCIIDLGKLQARVHSLIVKNEILLRCNGIVGIT